MCENKTGIRKIFCEYLESKFAAEVQGAILMLVIGIWLMFNDTFQVSAVYRIMANIATEKEWGIVFILVGTLQLIFIKFHNRYFKIWWYFNFNGSWLRKHILLICGAIWLVLFFGVLQGDARALSTPMYLYFALNAFRAFFCAKTVKVDT